MDNDFQYMRYDEAAKRLKIKVESVRVMARRYRWPKHKGNDKRTLVGVPVDRINRAITNTGIDIGADTGIAPETSNTVHELQKQVAVLATELKHTVEKVTSLEKRCSDLQQDRDAWHEQAQKLAEKKRFWWQWQKAG